MTAKSPYPIIVRPFGVLLIILTVTTAPAEAGLLEKVKSFTKPGLAPAGLVKAIGDYTKGVLKEGTALVKEGLSGNVDAATYNRRADDFLDRKANLGVTAFLQDAAENLKLKVSNPLASVKDTLGDTRLGRAAASVKEKLWTTTAESTAFGVTTPDAQSGAIDPRIALDVQEEETEWYQAETGIMDETPLPQAEVVAHVDQHPDESPDSGWHAYGKGDGQGDSVQRDCENDWAGCLDDASNQDLQANAQDRDPWSDIDDGANEWEGNAALDCTGPWVDIDCGDEYQGDSDRSDETDVAGVSVDAQGGTYQEAMDRLLGEETALYSDEYSASDEGYEEALAQLEAEAAERERERLAAEAAERERQARLAAEAAERERERQARLAAAEAEREREARRAAAAAERERRASSNRGNENVAGSILGAILGGAIRGLDQANARSRGTPNYGFGGRRGTSGGGANSCDGMNAEIERVTAKLNRNVGMCLTAREVKQVFTRAASYYQNNNCPAGLVQYSREMITWANQTERQVCN